MVDRASERPGGAISRFVVWLSVNMGLLEMQNTDVTQATTYE